MRQKLEKSALLKQPITRRRSAGQTQADRKWAGIQEDGQVKKHRVESGETAPINIIKIKKKQRKSFLTEDQKGK